MRVVIIGGGFAGVKTALELSKRHIGTVTLVSNEDHFLHHATLYATATGRAKAESVVPLVELFAGHANVKVVKDTLTSVDPTRKLAVCANGQYEYDALVLAIGSVTTFFGIKGMAEHAYGIKSLTEVNAFSQHIKDEVINNKHLDRNYVVVGGGPTGIELAGALDQYLEHLAYVHHISRAKVRVTVVEAAPRILPRLSKTASRLVEKRLTSLGITVLTNHKVEALSDDAIVIDGKKVPTRTVIWTSGVANHPFFAEHSDLFDLAPNGRVNVDPYLAAQKNIYVLGDNNTVQYSGMAWPALDQAVFVARHLARKKTRQPLLAFRPKQPPCGIPVGEKWAYVEWHGIYISGYLGHLVRRAMELRGYKSLLPRQAAVAAWRAHDIADVD